MKRTTTEIGKYLKKLRVDKSENLADMAKKLSVTSSFLSAVEVGKSNIPNTMVERITETYSFSDTQKKEFFEACSLTKNKVELTLGEGEAQQERNEVALTFGWKFSDLSDKQISKIKEVLDEGE